MDQRRFAAERSKINAVMAIQRVKDTDGARAKSAVSVVEDDEVSRRSRQQSDGRVGHEECCEGLGWKKLCIR